MKGFLHHIIERHRQPETRVQARKRSLFEPVGDSLPGVPFTLNSTTEAHPAAPREAVIRRRQRPFSSTGKEKEGSAPQKPLRETTPEPGGPERPSVPGSDVPRIIIPPRMTSGTESAVPSIDVTREEEHPPAVKPASRHPQSPVHVSGQEAKAVIKVPVPAAPPLGDEDAPVVFPARYRQQPASLREAHTRRREQRQGSAISQQMEPARVKIHIGRIEIQAVGAEKASPPPASTRLAAKISLEEFLKDRET